MRLYFGRTLLLTGAALATAILCVKACSTQTKSPEKARFLKFVGTEGTEHGRDGCDENYYTTNSDIPIMPSLSGFLATHGTYRHLTVNEQVLTLIGEAKHGLWRAQDNGFIREYLKAGKTGLDKVVDPNYRNLTVEQFDIIKNNYASYLEGEGEAGYKFPKDLVSANNTLNYIDLTIYHKKYNKSYEGHVPIDLPIFNCLFGQPNYPYAADVWKYIIAQPMANKIGPLGRRAGLDIKEHYLNVVQLKHFPDAGLWINIGIGDASTDFKRKSRDELRSAGPQTINFKRVDASKMKYELYLAERPLKNQLIIFFIAVVDSVTSGGTSTFSYVRPDGLYWQQLKQRQLTANLGKKILYFPELPIEEDSAIHKMIGLPVYGHNHPNRRKFGLVGGACPDLGGDRDHYPWGVPGGAWPDNYQEITPICDALCADVKAWTNLYTENWFDERLGLGNSAINNQVRNYTVQPNVYGYYTDKYLTHMGEKNPYYSEWTEDTLVVKDPEQNKPDDFDIQLNFTKIGWLLNYTSVTELDMKEPPDLPCGCGTRSISALSLFLSLFLSLSFNLDKALGSVTK